MVLADLGRKIKSAINSFNSATVIDEQVSFKIYKKISSKDEYIL